LDPGTPASLFFFLTLEGVIMDEETKIERIKRHFKERKDLYVGIGIGIGITGITCLIMRGRHASVPRVLDGPARVTVRPLAFLSNQRTNVVAVIERAGRGHPGYLVRCLETGEIYLSQIEAASAINTYPSVMSGHLQGKLPDVHGMHFERVNLNAK
jgi:hypothetical protein